MSRYAKFDHRGEKRREFIWSEWSLVEHVQCCYCLKYCNKFIRIKVIDLVPGGDIFFCLDCLREIVDFAEEKSE